MKDFEALEKKLGVTFANQDLLVQAFTHRSYINENPGFRLSHNERLEFLGDAVIELIVTAHLYASYPDKDEGYLTNWRAALVNAKIMAKIADELGFNDYLLLSRGEAKEEGKARNYILANSFEAFVGALYLDQGYGQAEKFIVANVLPKLPEIIKAGSYKDAKSKFQEEAQDRVGITPSYKVLKESGPDHEKRFTVGVYLGGQQVAEGEGLSKQEAEEAAAAKALETKQWK